MTEFDYNSFNEDLKFAVKSVKDIIINNSNETSIDISDKKDKNQTTENSCICLINLYLLASKVYENLSKSTNQTPKKQDDVPKSSLTKSKLDNLFMKKE